MIRIDYCGYHTHNPDQDLIYRPTGTISYLFLMVLAPMIFYFPDGSLEKAKPGACILYTPGTAQHYTAEKEFFNSYVHFFCDKQLVESYGLKENTLFYPYNQDELHWLLKKINQEFLNTLTESDSMLSLYFQQLLILLKRDLSREVFPAEQRENIFLELLAIRNQMLGQCELPWTIEQLCDILSIGKSQLYKYYQRFFHCAPKEELIRARLQKARYLMSNEAVTIKQAAYESGFQNINHFNRIFKSYYGCAPGEFRNNTFLE